MSGGIALKSAGTWARGFIGTPITPTLPTRTSGDLLVLVASTYAGASDLTPDTLTALSSGAWQLVDYPNGNAPTFRHLRIYLREASGDSGDAISIDWGGTANSADIAAVVHSLTGDIPGDLSSIIVDFEERGSTSTGGVGYPTATPPRAGCCVLAIGKRLKSNTVDSPGLTFGNLANFTKIGDFVETGNFRQAFSVSLWNQTTATSIALQSQSSSPADSTQGAYGIMVVLQSSTSVSTSAEIGDVDTDNIVTSDQTGVVVHGVGFGASQGAGSVLISDGALTQNLTVTDWSDTAITVNMALGNLRYGLRTLTVTNDSGFSDSQAFQLNPPTDRGYVDLLGPFVPPSQRVVSVPDLASGWQLEWSNVTNGFSLSDVTLFEDGEWVATPGLYTFDVRANDGAGWGGVGTQTLGLALPLITGDPSDQTIQAGQSATFAVFATGSIASYQWTRNGLAIDGATSSSYTTAAAILTDSGAAFACTVSNASGGVTSAPAILSVIAAPPVVVPTPPVVNPPGSNANILSRLDALLPAGWFSAAPVKDAILAGFSAVFGYNFDAIAYLKLQTRIATATGAFLDLIAYDFFGTSVVRQPGQSDASFRNTIVAYLFRHRNTRRAIISAIERLLGTTPTVVEPQRAADTGGYGVATAMGYGVAGRYGSMSMPLECFVDVTIPASLLIGPPYVAGYGSSVGGYGVGQIEYVGIPALDPIAVADVYAALDAVRPVTGIIWANVTGTLAPSGVSVTFDSTSTSFDSTLISMDAN